MTLSSHSLRHLQEEPRVSLDVLSPILGDGVGTVCDLIGKESACKCKRHGFNPWIRKIPWSRKWQPAPAFWPGEFHRQRNLVGYILWGHKELGTTEGLFFVVVALHGMWDLNSLVCPLNWMLRVSSTGLPGKSQFFCSLTREKLFLF